MSKKVTIRSKLIKDCKSSLYLDFYPLVFNRKTGKYTRYEKTNYFVYNDFQSETIRYTDSNGKAQSKIEIIRDKSGNSKKLTLSPAQKLSNRENLESVELYRAKRFKEITKPDIYSEEELLSLELSENKKKVFTEYFKEKADNATKSIGAWKACYGYFEKFYGNILFKDINKPLIEDFRQKLLATNQLKSPKVKLKRNSAASYFIKFAQVLNLAFEENYLTQNFRSSIECIDEEEVLKNFLTLDECKTLFSKNPDDEVLKKYCIFAFLSGLRFSDISNLKWIDVTNREGIDYIYFGMQKTSVFQYHPISKEALSLMGERKFRNDFVFKRIAQHCKVRCN